MLEITFEAAQASILSARLGYKPAPNETGVSVDDDSLLFYGLVLLTLLKHYKKSQTYVYNCTPLD